jgi:predicted TIM-barrel fold metal-dependent hydrolase
MTTVFDAHCHCFPPLAEDHGVMAKRLAELQYHVRFHTQGIRRARDHARVEEPLLAGERDGASWNPDVAFRIGKFGRLEFTHNGEDYYIQWMSPSLRDMSSPAEYIVSQMDYAGVDRAVLHHDRLYGRLDEFFGECVRRYPDRLVALAQVDEWAAGEPEQIERVRHEITDLGMSGLYFSTGGFFHNDFATGVNDPGLEPLWDLVAELGVPVHWYAASDRRPRLETNLSEIAEFTRWAEAHPTVPSVLTHGLTNIVIDVGGERRFTVPSELITLLQRPNWSVELMLHLMHSDAEFPPHSPDLCNVVETLVREVGADRLLWGSDMPACERTLTYRQSMLLFQTRCDFLSDGQRAAILGGNLARLYPPRG